MLPLLAVLLVTASSHRCPVGPGCSPRSRLVEYAFGALFGVLTFLIWLVGRLAEAEVLDALLGMLTRAAWLALFGMAAFVVYRIWRTLYHVAKPKPQPGVYGQPQSGWPQQQVRLPRARATRATGSPRRGQYGQPGFAPPPQSAPPSGAAPQSAPARPGRRSPPRRSPGQPTGIPPQSAPPFRAPQPRRSRPPPFGQPPWPTQPAIHAPVHEPTAGPADADGDRTQPFRRDEPDTPRRCATPGRPVARCGVAHRPGRVRYRPRSVPRSARRPRRAAVGSWSGRG